MFKRMIVALFISMLVISSVYAEPIRAQEYLLNPYEIGIDKELDAPGLMKIEYRNIPVSNSEVKIAGTVTVPLKYDVVDLHIDYYVFDRNKAETRVVLLELKQGAIPNTFTFDSSYPLDLMKYEFELFVIEFINEERDTQSI